MSRIKAPETFGDVAIAELGLTLQDCEAAGFEVAECWDGRPGVSHADAYRVSMERQAASEVSQAAWQQQMVGQREWLIGRETEYRAAYGRALRGRRDPSAHVEARAAAIKATFAYERKHAPEKLGFPASVRTPADTADVLAPSARWGAA